MLLLQTTLLQVHTLRTLKKCEIGEIPKLFWFGHIQTAHLTKFSPQVLPALLVWYCRYECTGSLMYTGKIPNLSWFGYVQMILYLSQQNKCFSASTFVAVDGCAVIVASVETGK